MKVMAFNGSPNDDGVIQNALELMCAELEQSGIKTEIVQVGRENIRGCIDCCECMELGKCTFNDDIVNSSAEKVNNADGIIIGSPVYYGSIAGNFKCFLDRLFFSGLRLEYKAACAVVSCRRAGGINAFHQMNNYFNLTGAFIAPSVYWEIVHGSSRNESFDDEEGLYVVKRSARSMAWLIKSLELAKRQIPLPEVEVRPWTNFIR